MHTELLAQSPLLVLPLAAMFLFLAVFVVVAVRATLQSREEVETIARLPLKADQ
jgi:4-hydroxybenzoate polyprenyltransferase